MGNFDNICECDSLFTGKTCNISVCPTRFTSLVCSGHGSCSADTLSCQCVYPWIGEVRREREVDRREVFLFKFIF